MLPLAAMLACGSPQKEVRKAETSGNPIANGWYADPEVAILNNQYWIFPTYSAKYEEQVFLDAFSSDDLVNWTKHEHVIDTSIVSWVHKAMWAPSIIEKDGKYFIVLDGSLLPTPYDNLWNPVFNETGNKLLIKAIINGEYNRILHML